MRSSVVVAAVMLVVAGASCRSTNDAVVDPWLAPAPSSGPAQAAEALGPDRILLLAPEHYAGAARRLDTRPVVRLSREEVARWVPKPPARYTGSRQPYLVRCVSAGDPAHGCSVTLRSRELSVSCFVLTHHPVVPRHTPIIVLLEEEPSRVYVGFGAAE